MSRDSRVPVMTSAYVINREHEALSLNASYMAHGGRNLAAPEFVNQSYVVRPGDPEQMRVVVLRSIRIAASDGYLVAVLDGRNTVADWSSVRVTRDLDKARRAANRLALVWGRD